MNTYELKSIPLTLIILILSSSLITFQLHLINILTITQWYHFAYMVISIALLGFGAAGSVISLFKEKLLQNFNLVLFSFTLFTGLFISISVSLSQLEIFYFDSFRVFTDISYIWKLFTFYILFFLPFFSGAIVIGLVFIKNVNKIGYFYFANMVGSGSGAILAVFLMWILPPEYISSFLSTLILISSLFSIPRSKKNAVVFIIPLVISIIAVNVFRPSLRASEYKSLSKVLKMPQSKIIDSNNSPYGQIKIVSSPYIRYSPGLSLLYPGQVNENVVVFSNGDWLGPLLKSDTSSIDQFEYSTEHLPYVLSERRKVLCLNAGSGRYIRQAMNQSVSSIVAVEPNKLLTDLLKMKHQNLVDSLYNSRSVEIHNISSRSFILSSDEGFDLIQLPIIDAFGGTSGLLALKEDFLLTKNSFSDMFEMLSDSGMISLTTWIDYPYKNSLKVISTLAEVLNEKGITEPSHHLAAIRNWNIITLALKKSTFQSEEIDEIRSFCSKMNFDPVILSDIKDFERNHYNKIKDTSFFSYIEELLNTNFDNEKLYSNYPFNIRPATDDKPYFAQFLKWKSINHISDYFGKSIVPFFEIGYFLLYLTFFQIFLLSLFLILLPLFYLVRKNEFKTSANLKKYEILIRSFLYFSCIGLGYMFFEIICIQRFSLYFGNIIYSAALVICLMLIASGLGSLVSQKLNASPENILKACSIIVSSLILFMFVLDPVIKSSITYSLTFKILIAAILVVPISFIMGMPFPLALRYLANQDKDKIPWAWGVNGIFSVIGVVLATIIAVELGFLWLMILTTLSYLITVIIFFKRNVNATSLS